MTSKATIAGLAVAMVAFLVLAGVWSAARADYARLNAIAEGVALDKHLRALDREQFWFNAMFISGNIALVFLAHLGALRRRESRAASLKSSNPSASC